MELIQSIRSYFPKKSLDEIINLVPELNIPHISDPKFYAPFKAVKAIKRNVRDRTYALNKELKCIKDDTHKTYLKTQLGIICASLDRIRPYINLLILRCEILSSVEIQLFLNKKKYDMYQRQKQDKLSEIYEEAFSAVYSCKTLLEQMTSCENEYDKIICSQ